MQSNPKLTFRGGAPASDLFTVTNGTFKVHLYECNRSQLVALSHAIQRVDRSLDMLSVTPSIREVLDLIQKESAAWECEATVSLPASTQPQPPTPAAHEAVNPASN